MLLFDDYSDADDAASSAPSTNGNWALSDEESEDAPDPNAKIEVILIQEVESTRYNSDEPPVNDEVVVTSKVLAPMQSVPATVQQHYNSIVTQIELLKTQKKNVSNNTSLIPGFMLTTNGRNFYLLPIDTQSWNEYRMIDACEKCRKESKIRSRRMLEGYLEYLHGA